MNKKLNLISFELCPYVQRAAIILEEKGVEHDCTYIDLADKPTWFLKLSPLGKVPVLQVDDEVLFESSVICEYLDEITPSSLHPTDPLLKAKHRAWMEFASAILSVIAAASKAKEEAEFQEKLDDLKMHFQRLEGEVQGPYFSGARFHMVDAFYGSVFRYFDAWDRIKDFSLFSTTPKVMKWREQLRARPSIRDAVPADYVERLQARLRKKDGYLSRLIRGSTLVGQP